MVEETFTAFQHNPELEAWARANISIEKSWSEGVKHITGFTRLQRAEAKCQETKLSDQLSRFSDQLSRFSDQHQGKSWFDILVE